MRSISKVFICTLLLSNLIICFSCKKEVTNTPPPAVNNLLSANAGADQRIILPSDSLELSGSAIGKIISYQWSQVAGPNESAILDSKLAKTKVKNLVQGVYEFQLKVMNASGDSAFDYVDISVVPPKVFVGLVQVGKLSLKRYHVAAVAAGNKIFFAGGTLETGSLSSRVDIYDVITKTWSIAELSEPRSDIGAVVVGNKILFAGGIYNWSDYGDIDRSTRVDIYDIITNTWSTTEMPGEVSFNHGITDWPYQWDWDGTTAAAGNKAIFCNASYSKAYIYDVSNNSWTTSLLSTPSLSTQSASTFTLASASVGNKILITGNGTKNVDVYDVTTNLWTVDSLSESSDFIIASSLNNKAFFAGARNKVDIYDNATQTWSVAYLTTPSTLAGAASSGNKMLFFGDSDSTVNIYDTSTNTWSVSYVWESFSDGSVFISTDGNAYATKGDQVWRVQL